MAKIRRVQEPPEPFEPVIGLIDYTGYEQDLVHYQAEIVIWTKDRRWVLQWNPEIQVVVMHWYPMPSKVLRDVKKKIDEYLQSGCHDGEDL